MIDHLRAMQAEDFITMHRCTQGWSGIAVKIKAANGVRGPGVNWPYSRCGSASTLGRRNLFKERMPALTRAMISGSIGWR